MLFRSSFIPHVDLDRIELIGVRRAMKDDIASLHAGLECGHIIEIAAHGGRAECFDGRRGLVATRQRTDFYMAGAKRADQMASDEAGTSGDECSLHGL